MYYETFYSVGGMFGQNRSDNFVTRVRRLKCGFYHIMTSSNENIFRVTDHLCGEFTGHR